MMVSQKADYALKALLDLAMNASAERPSRTAEIARRASVPEKFLEAILVDLRKARLVRSRRGPEGGHALARPASEITAGQVRAAIDGPLSLPPRAKARGAGEQPAECVGALWAEAALSVERVLGDVTLEDLARRAATGQGVIDFSI